MEIKNFFIKNIKEFFARRTAKKEKRRLVLRELGIENPGWWMWPWLHFKIAQHIKKDPERWRKIEKALYQEEFVRRGLIFLDAEEALRYHSERLKEKM